MTFKRNTGGAWTDISTTIKRHDGSSFVQIGVIKRHNGATWQTAWSAVSIADQPIYHIAPTLARAGYRLNSSGVAEKREGNTYTTLETWLIAGSSSDYECRCTVNSGTLTAGTIGTWVSLGSSQEWRVDMGTTGTNSAEIFVEIRNASGTVIDSATINLEAEHS